MNIRPIFGCTTWMYNDILLKKYLITTITGDKYLYESTIAKPFYVLKSIRKNNDMDLLVEDLYGKEAVVSIQHIVSVERYEEQEGIAMGFKEDE